MFMGCAQFCGFTTIWNVGEFSTFRSILILFFSFSLLVLIPFGGNFMGTIGLWNIVLVAMMCAQFAKCW